MALSPTVLSCRAGSVYMSFIGLNVTESSDAHAESCRIAATFQHALEQIMQLHQWQQAASDHLVCRQLPVYMKTLPA